MLIGDKFMPELHLKLPGFTYSAPGPFTKHCERIQKLGETGHCQHLCRKELGKACFAHDAAYSNSNSLGKRTASNEILKNGAYEIVINPKYDRYQRALASMIYKVFDMKTGWGASVNEELTREIHIPIIKKFKRRKVFEIFKDNIWVADLAWIGSLSSKNKTINPNKAGIFERTSFWGR